jgi:saccharopine dehydrogenase (NAD+, L-lysine-forming)
MNTPTRILILGGYGSTGLPLARLLLRETEASLVLAGRDLEKAQRAAERLNQALNGHRVAGIRTDAADRVGLLEAFREVDLVLVTSSTARHAEAVARAALAAGIDYLDIHYSAAKTTALQGMAEDIRRAGRCFITEAGFHPGLPAALARYAAGRLERVDRIVVAAVLNQEGGIPFTSAFTELVEGFRDYQAMLFKDGKWRKVGWFSRESLLRVDFGPDLGARSCYPMMMEEMRALPEMFPFLRQAGFYIAGIHWIPDWVVTPLVMGALFVSPRRAAYPMAKLLWWSWKRFSRPPYGIAIRAAATGMVEEKPAVAAVTLQHGDGYILTAVPVVACLLQYLDGSIRKPGLHLMGDLVDPARLLADTERMGISVRLSVEAT